MQWKVGARAWSTKGVRARRDAADGSDATGGCAPHPTGLEMPSSHQVEAGVPLQLDAKILWTEPHGANNNAIVRSHFQWTMQTATGHISLSGTSEAIFMENTPGVYTVTVVYDGLSATTRVAVTKPDSNTTTETLQ